ncbi:MAG TPA: NADPH-dependent assimilatory sulfite reductase hemoprotein subunit [Ktedonobacteraceae bacterium]|nr:NADPH-dependent assimilatory sulfite reductase hemoprotein subunit [Ktedonobacteraceae bacterium]
MPDHGESSNDLLHLGPGTGSKVEHIKVESHHLRGHIAEELAQDTNRFSDPQVQLMKFHGVYQQENRDVRQARKASGEEKAYQFMVRTRIPGGRITAEQYLVHDDLADTYGNSTLRITTRQGFQLHGVLKGVLAPTIKAVNGALLTTLAACGDVNRNVMACPAPIGDCAHRQIEDISQRIAQHLTPRSHAYHEIWVDGEQVKLDEPPREDETEPIYGATYLPRKFKIGVAAPGDNCIDVYTQDIGLVPEMKEGHLEGFTVLIGGGMGMTHNKGETYPRLATPLCFATSDEILPLVETIVKVQRDYGDRQNRKHARMKYVVEERGIAWFRNEVEQRLGYRLQDPRSITWQHAEDHLGWHKQEDGRWFVGLFVENGRIKDVAGVQMRSGLRHAIAEFRPNIRLTPGQNILLTDLDETQRAPLTALLASYGIPVDPAEVGTRRFSMACPALPTCGLALAEAERALPSIIRQIETELAALGMANVPLGIRMTGCPNGCVRPFMGDIGFVGRTKDVYNIYVGGDMLNTRMNTLYAASVHVQDLVATLRPLLALWQEQRLPAENFGDFCHRVGLENLREQATSPHPEGENHARVLSRHA